MTAARPAHGQDARINKPKRKLPKKVTDDVSLTEQTRRFIGRLRDLTGNHRRNPRYRVRLPVRVSLLELTRRIQGIDRLPALTGSTHDISATGLGLVVPSIRIGERYLTDGDHMLRITCALPSGDVELRVRPVRYTPLDDEARGYLIGAHITAINTTDSARLADYLRTLR